MLPTNPLILSDEPGKSPKLNVNIVDFHKIATSFMVC